MSILSDFEDRLARAVEGAFAGAFRSPVQPAELARALAHAMDDGKSAGVGKIYAPSVYTVQLSREDAGKLGDAFEVVLAAELSTFLIDHARKRGYTLAGSPIVKFGIARDLRLGRFRVGSEMASDAPAIPVAPVPARAAEPPQAPGRPSPSARPFVPAPGTSLPGPLPAVAVPAAAPPTPAIPVFFDHAAPEAPAAQALDAPLPASSPIAAPAPADRATAPSPASIVVGEHGHEVILNGDRVAIGRTADCAIQLDDANVSRGHAVLAVANGTWTVQDLGSTNGTWIGGQRVQHAVLHDGDVITVGATRLLFRAGRG